MSLNVPGHYVIQFANTIEMLLGQEDFRLGGACAVGRHIGKQAAVVDQLGLVEMNEVTSRFEPIGRTDAAVDRRWLLPKMFDLNQQLDSFDEHKLLIDPKSKYVQAAVNAANRQKDRVLINAFFADAKTGEQGGTTTSFPAGQQIAVGFGASGNVGLTYAKLKEAKRLLMAADVNVKSEPLFVGITAKQHDNLLNEIQLISLDYNEKPVLQEGLITRFLGFNFIHSELFATDSNSYRRVPCWAKSGMHLGIWKDVETNISQRNDLSSQPWQAYVKMMINATRTNEEKVIEIKCSEA